MTSQLAVLSAQGHNLPPQPTSFIGRDAEIDRIRTLLTDPSCRLLTLVGPGGIGKTRLAIQTAAGLIDHFAEGVYFAPLQGIDAGEHLVSAVAEGVNFSLSGHQAPLAQVLNYLSDKRMLLLLDNFEQLLDQGGRAILSEMLAAAPALKLLVTSREVLNLQEEWLYPLQGLPVPATVQPGEVERGDAIHLFLDRARRVQPDFSLVQEAEAVRRICQLVEGTPLAVELAASWSKALSCRAIADEIQRSIDFLVTPLRNVPSRHRSMGAVFDYSWRLLTETEQQVFQRLSVFRGDFDREAAKFVAEATLAILAALVDKSLLRRETDDRYQIHELLRQYGQEKLQSNAEAVTATYQAHCTYYANFLDRRRKAIESGDQRETTLEIEAELENIRAARQWATAHQRLPEIHQSIHTFALFCHFQSRYLEGANAFEQDLASLESQEPVGQAGLMVADILVRLGWFYIRLGRYEEAASVLKRSQALFATLGAAPYPASGTDFLPPLAILAIIRGDSREALRLGYRSRQMHAARNDRQNLAFALHGLTSATLAQGDYEAARRYAQQACKVAEAAGNRWYLAYCLNGWGNVARAMGDYTEAEQHFQASYRIREGFDDPEGMAVALNHLGEIAIRRGDFAKAQQRYRQSFAIYNEINDRGGLGIALNGLGQSACGLQAYPSAAQYFQRALEIAAEIQFFPLICTMFISVGELLLNVGMMERGLELLAFIQDHPTSEQETKDRAAQTLKHHQAELAPKQHSAATHGDQSLKLESMIAGMQDDLLPVENQAFSKIEIPPATVLPAENSLLDPLTQRELQVLRLMAAGHSNREIGEELVLAVGSVKWYASQIYSKLQVKNRTEAAARARELNLL